MTKGLLEQYVRQILSEANYDDVVDAKFLVRVTASKDVTLLDVYTGIRGIRDVITVTQEGKSEIGPEGKTLAEIIVSYNSGQTTDIDMLRKKILRINGVDLVLERELEV